MTFDQFVRSTAGDWTRLASYLRGRWQVPSAVDVDDVRQEMLLAAWRAVADLSMYGLIAFSLYLVFVAIRWPVQLWWRARKGPAPVAADEPTLREMMTRDTEDFGDTRYDARGDRRLRLEPRL